ncbi:MAG: FMN-binding protein [Gammaproteobacteria bacterium]|nr:FMN-binding protein [Gammaproteobacteria bacterium]
MSALVSAASGKEQSTSKQFLNSVFDDVVPSARVLLLSDKDRQALAGIFNHPLAFKRVRYWQRGDQTVWVLNEVGKHKRITAGFWLAGRVIKQAKVLAFRESRGWEIKYPYFLKQYKGLSLTADNTLNQGVDGISGATLSVRAMSKMARMALYLNQKKLQVELELDKTEGPLK